VADDTFRQMLRGVRSSEKDSFIAALESMEAVIEEWAAKYEEDMIRALSPNGRPFGMEKKSQQELLEEYKQMRGNPEAWRQFFRDRLAVALSSVDASNLEEAQAKHIADIVARWVIRYSADMEELLRRQEGGGNDQAAQQGGEVTTGAF